LSPLGLGGFGIVLGEGVTARWRPPCTVGS